MTATRATIAALALSTLLPFLAPRPFFSPDEAFYAQVAREMAETGDYVVPRFDGQPWLEKPPLVAWLLSGAFTLAGWGFPAAALVNTAATLATALLVGAQARRRGDDDGGAGLLAIAAYLTMLGPPTAAGTALTDPVLTLCTTAAVVAFLAERGGSAVLCGVFLGLGVLAKGPVAPLVVLPAIVGAAVMGRSVRRALVAIGVALAVAAPWHVLLGLRGLWGEYQSVFLGKHVVQRALVAERQGGPGWYYVAVLWLVAFPWGTQILLAALRWRRWLGPLEAVTIISTLLALSASATKLPHYLLPVLPWLAIALGRSAAAQLSGSSPPGARILTRVGGLAAAALLVLLLWWAPAPPLAGLVPPALEPFLLVAAGACPILGSLESSRRLRAAWLGWASLAFAIRAATLLVSLPNANRLLVEEPVARLLRDTAAPGQPLVAHGYFRPYLVTYGVRGWQVTTTPAELASALRASGDPTLALTSDKHEGELRAAAKAGHSLRELARVRGLGLLGGPVVEVALFRLTLGPDAGSWFTDMESSRLDVTGVGAVEGNPMAASYQWTIAPVAQLEILGRPAGDATLRLRGWGYTYESPPQTLVVRLNGAELGRTRLPKRPTALSFLAPASALRAAPQRLELEVTPLLVPARLDSSSTDERTLGVALDWVALDTPSLQLDLLR